MCFVCNWCLLVLSGFCNALYNMGISVFMLYVCENWGLVTLKWKRISHSSDYSESLETTEFTETVYLRKSRNSVVKGSMWGSEKDSLGQVTCLFFFSKEGLDWLISEILLTF